MPDAALATAGWLEVVVRTGAGGLGFVAFTYLCWRFFVRGLWERGDDPPALERGPGIRATLD